MLRLLIVAAFMFLPSVASAAFNFQSYGGWTAYMQNARVEAVTYDDYGACYGQGWDMDCGAPAISCASVATNAGLSDQNNAWCQQEWNSTLMSYYYDTDGIFHGFYEHEHRITVYGPGSTYTGCSGGSCSQHNALAQPASATLNANPITIVQGNNSILSWSSYDATSCTGTGFATGGATSGQVTVTPNATTNYSITCTGPGGSGSASRTVTVVTPQCSDGIDNDGDGLTDMSDWGCTSPTDTTEYHSGSSYTVPSQCGETGVPTTINCVAAEPVTIDCGSNQRAYYEPTATNKNCYSYNAYSHTTNWGTCVADASCSASGGCYCNGHWRWNGHNWDDYGASWEPGDPAGCQMSPSPLGTYSYTDYSVIEYRDGTIYGSGYGPQTAIGSYSTSGCTAPAAPGSASGLTATCNAAGTQATLSWSPTSGATGYYVRASNPGSCPSGWMQASWSSAWCTPNPDWVSGTSVTFPTTPSRAYTWGIHAANSGGYGGWTPGPGFTCTATVTECSDGIDNDGDGQTDTADAGCTGPTDTTESPNPVTADLTANPTSVVSGASSMLTWTSTGASSCSGTGFSTGGATSGSVSTGALTANSNYQVTCSGVSDTASVSVTNPTADITATPDRVNSGGSASLTWTTSQCTNVSVTKNGAAFSTQPTGTGVSSGAITAQTTFRVTCDSGTATDTVIVNLVPVFEEF